MIVTNDLIKSFEPCEDGYKYWRSVDLSDLVEFMRRAHADGYSGWASWLFCRVVPREMAVKYAANAARSALHIFESSSPDDGRPREALDAIDRGEVTDDVLVASRATHAATHATHAAHAARAARAAAHAATHATHASRATHAATHATHAAHAACAAAYATDAAHSAAHAAHYAAYAADAAVHAAYAAKAEKWGEILEFGISILEKEEK